MTTYSRIKDPKALSLLITLFVTLAASHSLASQGLDETIEGAPPIMPFVLLAIAALSLAMGSQLQEVHLVSTESGETTTILPSPGFAWMYQIERNWHTVALLASLMLTAVVLRWLPNLTLDDNYSGVTLAWSVAVLLYIGSIAPNLHLSIDWRAWWRRHQSVSLAVGGILLFALFVRVWQLDTIPFTLSGDEGSQGLEAVRVIEGKIRNPFSTGWLGVPTMSFFFNSVTIRFFGRTVTALRLPWAILGTMTVLITFLLVKQLKGTPLALITAALLAVYHYHIHFSRLGSNQIADPFFMPLALFFLFRALDRESHLDWALTGVVTGLALYFYAGARLTPVVIGVILAYAFIRDRRHFWQKHRMGMLVALGALLVVGAPMIQFGLRFPDDFNARINQVGIIQSGWLEQAVEAREESVSSVLFDQFQRAALAFNYYPDRTVWYGLHRPLLNPFFGSLFLLGLGYGLLRLVGRSADARLAPMMVWWWGGMLLGGMFTESPPSSQRLITLSVPVCFFVALAIWQVVQLAKKSIVGVPDTAILGLVVILFTIYSLVTYFSEYTPQRIFGGPYAELATEISPFLNEVSPDHRLYFVGAPWMYWGIATLPYLVPNADAVDVTMPVTELISSGNVSLEKGALFIFIPQRIEELETVKHSFPQGEEIKYYSPVDGRMMVALYEVSP